MDKPFDQMTREELIGFLRDLHESAVNSEDARDFNLYVIETLGARLGGTGGHA